jgi:hypothetical protein
MNEAEEGCGCQTDEVGPAEQLLRNKHSQGLWACEGSMFHHDAQTGDIFA